jgi:hypothetical protein
VEKEIWKQCEYYGAKYLVSNYGKVKGMKFGLLKQRIDIDGYPTITIGKYDNKRTSKKIHRLVAENFIPNLNNLPEINHIDLNKNNNYYKNLEWCTHTYNIKYSINKGSYNNCRTGIKNGRAILSEKDILNIRQLYQDNFNISEIARIYKRGWQTINHIVKRSTWKHI